MTAIWASTDYGTELAAAQSVARAAGAVIARHYAAGDVVENRKADDSPVTAADLEANDAIVAGLRAAFPGDGLLSEETRDDGARLARDRVWIVDPLDGTRDFVARTGDFAVHVALVVRGVPAVAVAYKPVGDELYWATAGGGAFGARGGGEPLRLRVSARDDVTTFRIGLTRFAIDERVRRFLAESGLGDNVERIGASIKMLWLARGDIELSVCLNDRENEWDTCAPELIVREAGGAFTAGAFW
jgi:3'(2'),5'-bisphosphate nucleotidase